MSARRRRTVYCACKHAMEGFTKAMAIELAPHDIRVNSLGPTFIETPLTKPFFENEAFRKEVLSKIKLGRIGQMDELTGAIVFLASDASRLMTGSALVVDGGWTAEYARRSLPERRLAARFAQHPLPLRGRGTIQRSLRRLLLPIAALTCGITFSASSIMLRRPSSRSFQSLPASSSVPKSPISSRNARI